MLVWVSQNFVTDLGVGNRAMFLSQVKPQLALMTEVQETFLTAIRFLSSVNTQVALQRLKVAEACSTGVAWIWLFPSMDKDVGTQVSYLDKSGSTCVTAVRLLTRVDARVSL